MEKIKNVEKIPGLKKVKLFSHFNGIILLNVFN